MKILKSPATTSKRIGIPNVILPTELIADKAYDLLIGNSERSSH